jgi:N-acetylated-alpha-linked acidic dipeptidase
MAQYLGLLGLRIADSIILPINTTAYAYEIDPYVDKLASDASLC